MAKFKRYEGYANSIPQTMIDENFPVCPFCHSNQPHWLLANKMTMTDTRTLYRCERCEATMSSSAIDAAAADGKQFAFNPGAAAFNAARKGRKGQNVNETYFKVEELGNVCTNTALLEQELPMHELQAMAGIAAPVEQPTPQPVQQPVYQQPVQQPVYQQPVQQPVYQQPVQQPIYQQPAQQPIYQQPVQQPVYQQPVQQPVYQQPVVPVEPAAPKKPSLVMPILSASFAIFAWVLGLLVNGISLAAAIVIFRFFLIIPALVFGIIGLIKSLKGEKNIVGIILSCVGLLVSLYLIYNIIRFFGMLASGFYY